MDKTIGSVTGKAMSPPYELLWKAPMLDTESQLRVGRRSRSLLLKVLKPTCRANAAHPAARPRELSAASHALA